MDCLNHLLSEEQRMLTASVRAFVEAELRPHEAECDKLGEVPPELAKTVTARALEKGLYAANLPESAGGGGLDYVSMALVESEFGKTSFGLHGLAHRPSEILLACNDEQAAEYLHPCVRAERKEFFALTEPEAGSDIMSMKTRAERRNGEWVINGAKHFISSPVKADFAILFAVTGEDETPRGPRKRITAFLVDTDCGGFDVSRGPVCAAQRAYPTFQLSFNDVRVPDSKILGAEGGGLELAEKWLKMGRVWVAAGCCGRAERLLALAADWAANRRQFGQPIGKFQGTSFKLADMATELRAACLLVYDAARKADLGVMEPSDAAMAKLFAAEMAGRAADNTVQIYGGMGLMEDLPVERLWRDTRLDRIWDGTSEIQRHIISRAMLRPLGA